MTTDKQPDPPPLRRKQLARQLLESEAWQLLILPHIERQLAGVESALLTKHLKKRESAAHQAVRARLIELRDLPVTVASIKVESEQ